MTVHLDNLDTPVSWRGDFTPPRSGTGGLKEILERVRRSARSPGGTSRSDWFLRGTEPGGTAASVESPRPRLSNPVSGTIIALDPDIPAGQQSVPFEADAGAGLHFALNGRELGEAALPFDWNPVAGRYTLALVDRSGRALDTAAFEVRGALVAEADEAAPPPDEESGDE